MHPNGLLLERLFTSLDQHNHEAMAACYHPQATFRDIAFELRGQRQIHAMWHMICQPDGHDSDIRTTFAVQQVDEDTGRANVVDDYTFHETGNKVHNVITSEFRFQDGLIVEHRDNCDPRLWGKMAFGGIKGWMAGRVRWLRSRAARKLIRAFEENHPEYREA